MIMRYVSNKTNCLINHYQSAIRKTESQTTIQKPLNSNSKKPLDWVGKPEHSDQTRVIKLQFIVNLIIYNSGSNIIAGL